MSDGPLREALAKQALAEPMPTDAAEEWRYSPISDLDLSLYTPRVRQPDPLEVLALPEDAAAVVHVVDGWVTNIVVDPESEKLGLKVQIATWADTSAALADANALDQLHAAFAPGALQITVARSAQITKPVRINNEHTGSGIAAFPHVQIDLGDDASLSVIERQASASGPGLSVSRVDLKVGNSARLSHSTLQDVCNEHWHLARHTSSTGSQATMSGAIAAFGGQYARLRTDAHLDGRGATGELVAVYFGDKEQVHDFRTFQHHSARDTTSDLVFKGTLDDKSGSIYTGMVQIHPSGAGTNANQTNRNIKLSEDAWAWSVPNLEIENSDVRCSHASTVSPVDPEQRFYLHARGVPPVEADKLIVAGFFNEVIERFPDELRSEIRDLVSVKLHAKSAALAS